HVEPGLPVNSVLRPEAGVPLKLMDSLFHAIFINAVQWPAIIAELLQSSLYGEYIRSPVPRIYLIEFSPKRPKLAVDNDHLGAFVHQTVQFRHIVIEHAYAAMAGSRTYGTA